MQRTIMSMLKKTGITVNGSAPHDIQIIDDSFIKQLLKNPSLIAGEAYMQNAWDAQALDQFFFHIFKAGSTSRFFGSYHKFYDFIFYHIKNLQTPKRSHQVAVQHYNLSNHLYRAMLGPSMAYSCGYWREASNLNQAQYAKYQLICDKLMLTANDTVLDIGCGWGGLCHYMAKYIGCRVVGLNISAEQIQFARDLTKSLPVDIVKADYRDHKVYNPTGKKFTKIVTVGFFEHVGHKNFGTLLKTMHQQLSDDGLALLHTIGCQTDGLSKDPWLHKYIFPNGEIPTLSDFMKVLGDQFIIEDLHNFGADYDLTLMAWFENFDKAWPELASQFDQTFYRMWKYYLLSCAGGFRARFLQLWQFVLTKNGMIGGYQSVR